MPALAPLLAVLLAAQTAADERVPRRSLDAARDAYAAAIAQAYGVPSGEVVVQPVFAGLPDNPLDALATPPFFAVRADWPGTDPGPRGFAAADGRTVCAKSPAAIADLLEAAGAKRRPAPVVALVRRLMWMYQPSSSNRLLESHPRRADVVAPTLVHDDTGLRMRWYVERGGTSGWLGVYRVDFALSPNGTPSFTENLSQ